MARTKHCAWCGEKIKPGAPTQFLANDKTNIYHELCLWGMCATKGWSYLQQPGGSAPYNLLIDCAAACHEYGAAGQGALVLGIDVIWYEREGEYYRPYHPQCAPSRVE